MIDLHSHLLPGLDDGSPDLEAAVALAREAEAGVTVMACTPHLRADFPAVRVAELDAQVRALQSALDAAGVGLRVGQRRRGRRAVGAERFATRTCARRRTAGCGTDLLVETPYGELPPIFEDLLFKIRVRGFRVLLAHPERNRSFQQDTARLLRLVDGDVLVQVTAASVVRRRARGQARPAADRRRPRPRHRGRPPPRGRVPRLAARGASRPSTGRAASG